MQQELYYKDALKLGQKEYRARLAKDEDPYLPVLDNIVPPEKSGWINDHELGRRHAQTVLGNRVDTSVYMAESEETLYSTLEKAIKDGNRMIFTVSPRMLKDSLRAAVEHPEVVVMNCSLNVAHRYLRTYYPRMYEVKFILGARQYALSPDQIIRMDYLAENVVGSIPSYKEMSRKGQDTVDMAGIPQAKKAVRKEENE